MEGYNIIDRLFEYREEKFIEEIPQDINILKNKIKNINRKEIDKLISNISEEQSKLKDNLANSIDALIADYNIMMAFYNKKYYKQGFIDATNIKGDIL